MKLYEITGDILQLQEMLIDDPDSQVVLDTLEGLTGELELKAEGYAMIMKNLQSEADAYKAEIQRMTERKRSLENSVQRLKDALFGAMEMTGTEKIKGNLFTISMRNGSPQLPKDLTINECPVAYLKEQDPVIDKVGLLAAVKSGEVDGIELVTSKSLSIR